MTTDTEAARRKLVEDFRALTADAEELLRATANQTGERVTAARAKVEERVREAREAVAEFGEGVAERARAAARSSIRGNRWQSPPGSVSCSAC